MITFRDLPPEEWYKLAPQFKGKSELPAPEYASIVVAERGVEIVGFVVTQFALHVEPLWVAPAERGTKLWKPLLEHAMKAMPPGTHFYGFNAHKGTEKIAETMGFTRHPWTVDEGVVGE